MQIIESGVREFLDTYKDTVYEGGLVAKLAIYSPKIAKLEEITYPIVAQVAAEYGLASDTILKFHKGSSDKKYPQPTDSQLMFDSLDRPFSNIRFVLLAEIGKEGWDCRSLTGIILSQEGDCPKNMVLQTSCRCLRQVEKNMPETALIYLNSGNADKLNAQLRQQHHISLKEFQSSNNDKITLSRFDRTSRLKLPPIKFYQLAVQYDEQTTEKAKPNRDIPLATKNAKITNTIKTQDFSINVTEILVAEYERGNTPALYSTWLYSIIKSSFGCVDMAKLVAHTSILRAVFDKITCKRNGNRYYSSQYNHTLIESNIRKAFCDKRAFTTKEELIPEEAKLLNISGIDDFNTIHTISPKNYYPEQEKVLSIVADDKGELAMSDEEKNAITALEAAGRSDMADVIRKKYVSNSAKDRSFHYLPYKTDSSFEQTFLKEIPVLSDVKDLGLEVYYNGDRALTEFKIRCYKKSGKSWQYVGMYTPDFLIIKRKDGEIHKAVIVETKGKIYANDPTFIYKRSFMQSQFTAQNNEKYGYKRFDYLYLEDTMSEKERIILTHNAIKGFFKEEIKNA